MQAPQNPMACLPHLLKHHVNKLAQKGTKQANDVPSSEAPAPKGAPGDEDFSEDESKKPEEVREKPITSIRTRKIGNEIITFEGNFTVTSYVQTDSDVLCVKYVPIHDFVAAGLSNGKIGIYNLAAGKYERTLRESDENKYVIPVTCIKTRRKNLSDKATLTATYVDGTVRCWEYVKAVCLFTMKENRQIFGLAYHHRLPKFITVGDDSRVILYDEDRGVQEHIYQSSHVLDRMDGHTTRVFGCYFHPSLSHEFITGGWDDTVQFWDVRQPNSTRYIYGVHICGDGVCVSPSGKELLTCSWQAKTPLQIWDYGSGKLIQSLQPDRYSSRLYCGRFVTNDIIVTAGSDLNLFRLVDVRNKTTLSTIQGFKSGVYSLDLSTAGVRRGKIMKLMDLAQSSNTAYSETTVSSYRSYKEPGMIPKMTFCSGNRVYGCEFKRPM
ncbi:WD repeat-containing protein 5 homolog [Anabrus simplex]|uniref:WD repeat-containing protein 5 homolog n=1 Tax=Anabrus simplex TaxID=316456 RepID=UPI0035A36505